MNEMNTNSAAGAQRGAPIPQGMKIDDKAIKKMAGEAVAQVAGVLGLDGGLADMLNVANDTTKGLAITMNDSSTKADVSCKIITEYGKNIPDIVAGVQDKVAATLQTMAGLAVGKVEVEVTDTMTREEYMARTSKNRRTS